MTKVMLEDLSLTDIGLTERVSKIRTDSFRAMPEICVERPRLLTDYYRSHGFFDQERIGIRDKAAVYRHVLEQRKPLVWHDVAYERADQPFTVRDRSLFLGSTTTKFKGVPIYPEFLALSLWPELHSISQREANPLRLSPEDAEILNRDVFPFWLESSVLEVARARRGLPALGPDESPPNFWLHEMLVFFIDAKPNCLSHTIPDLSRAVNEGLGRVIEDAAQRKHQVTGSRQDFYQALVEVLEGIVIYSHRIAEAARERAVRESAPAAWRELEELAAIYERVPEHPARTFREALTTIWICWMALHLENPNIGLSFGRLDQLLYPFYRRDIDEGRLTVAEAVELLCCLWLKIGDHSPAAPDTGEQLFGGSGSNQAITIGGVDREGRDAVNDLTYLIIRTTELMMLRDPNLNARFHQDVNEQRYLRRLCEANLNTRATPALHNDRAVIKALTGRGETLKQARDYGIIGCVEPVSNGRHYGLTGAVMFNLTAALELTLFNGRHRHTGLDYRISPETGDPGSFKSFDELKAAFRSQVEWLVDQAVGVNNALGQAHQACQPTPILSALFEGPMDAGKDLVEGGAVINSSGVSVVGLADVTDSLSAIEHVVFEEKEETLPEILEALEGDYRNDEALRTRLANPERTPKFGCEHPAADRIAHWIVAILDEAFSRQQNYRGGSYRVGYWSMTTHSCFGMLTEATPNGRHARRNFSSGITPVSGVATSLTKALNSVATIPVEHLSNGVALNLKYTPELDGRGAREKMIDNLTATVGGYFEGAGGMEVQFNIENGDTFRQAKAHPEKYPELLVRVSGYTAYFKELRPMMQDEIIERTEYRLSTGEAVGERIFSVPRKEVAP